MKKAAIGFMALVLVAVAGPSVGWAETQAEQATRMWKERQQAEKEREQRLKNAPMVAKPADKASTPTSDDQKAKAKADQQKRIQDILGGK